MTFINSYTYRSFLYILFVFGIVLFSCNSENNTKTEKTELKGEPKIEFYDVSHDFGTLIQGEIVECTFAYKNAGNAPLLLTYVEADCGCTIPEYNKEAILPGEEGKIKVIFDSQGFRNNIYKTIDVETNADSLIIELVISAFIEISN